MRKARDLFTKVRDYHKNMIFERFWGYINLIYKQIKHLALCQCHKEQSIKKWQNGKKIELQKGYFRRFNVYFLVQSFSRTFKPFYTNFVFCRIKESITILFIKNTVHKSLFTCAFTQTE